MSILLISGVIQLEKVVRNLSLTLAEAINDTTWPWKSNQLQSTGQIVMIELTEISSSVGQVKSAQSMNTFCWTWISASGQVEISMQELK